MYILLLLAIGMGMLVADLKEFFYKGGPANDLGYILFKMMFSLLFIQINAFILILNKYLKSFEKALASVSQTKEIKIENHTHETLVLPDKEETIEKEYSPEPPVKRRPGRSVKRNLK